MGSLNSIIFQIIIINQFVHHHPVVAAKSVLRPGDELNPTSTLVSPGGNFTLGFFTVDTEYTNLTYLGISYTSDSYDKNVWVANRDIRMDSSGSLIIDDTGTLKVVNRGGNNTYTTLFNVSKQVVGSGNTIAVLKDSGNFVLYDVANGNQTLWQSFDHPTDTLLEGMKLGYNLTTRQNWTLTSWLTDQIPASGSFTLRLEQFQNSARLVIYRRGEVHWSSGPWDNGQFHTSQELFHLKASLITDASGMYCNFQTFEPIVRILQLSSEGYLGFDSINVTTICNGYDQSNDGCVISDLPTCRGQRDSFQQKRGTWSGEWSIDYDESSNISLSDCMERCWNDCNCTGYLTNSNGTGCYTYTGENKTFIPNEFQEQLIYVLVSDESVNFTSTLHPLLYHKRNKKTWIWVLCVAILLTLLLAALLCYVKIRRRRREERTRNKYIHQLTGSHSFNYGDELEKGIKDAPNVKIFSFKAISAATDNFSNKNKLGQGGYGPVYKGNLLDGRQIAVKRLSKTSGQGIDEFKNELILISKLQHTNLVRLYGCCIHQKENMLIYEFMPNKSLDFFLFAEDKKETIDWRIRFNIIEGVAQGLLYLHKYSRMKVIHRDMKVSNVLLDENMNPKIADFGMARIVQQNETEAITHRLVGTRGYIAPEYVMEGTFSIKSDVFSFGVLILEIISGKRNSSFYNLERPLNLMGYAWELWKGHASLELKDEALGKSFDVKQLLRTIHTGLLCVQENADDRPTMSEVISMLNNEIMNLPNPKQPAFYTCTQTVQIERKSNNPVSMNGLTVTTMEAREYWQNFMF